MTYWLQQIVIATPLIAAIVLLASFPARHELLPLWPAAVDEYVLSAEGDSAERVLLQSSAEPPPSRQTVVAQSRPLSVVALQPVGEEISYGFLAGYRAEHDGPLLPVLPEPLRLARVDLPVRSEWVLVMIAPDDQLLEFPADRLLAFYRPNQLSLSERFGLLLARVLASL